MNREAIRRRLHLLHGLLTLVAALGAWSMQATASAQDATALERCRARDEPDFEDDPWDVLGNFINRWPAPEGLVSGDVLTISATGPTRIDIWGTHKNVAGEGSAGASFPLPGAPMRGLIGRVTAGSITIPGRGTFSAGRWFFIGAGVNCISYTSRTRGGALELAINDTTLWDNAGGPEVRIRQYFP